MKKSISFAWRFVPDFKESYLDSLPENAETIDIPHAPKEVPLNYFSEKDYQGQFTYEKTFDVEEFSDRRVFLRFEGVMLKVHPYLNGVDLGERVSGWLPVTYDITEQVKEKDNRLLVVIDSREDPLVPPFGKAVDYLTFAGIYRPVYVETRPLTYLKDLHVCGDMKGNLEIKTSIVGYQNADLRFTLYHDGQVVKEFSEKNIRIPDAELWDIDHPNLYELEATLTSQNGVDTLRKSFGFRDIAWRPDGFFLNGKHLKLIGLNRHQNYPYVGCSLPKSAQEEDAFLIKAFGSNIVRTSHYPQGKDFLDCCDRIGLLVVDEIPGWQFIGKDPAWRAQFQNNVRGMILEEMDHPSLIAYGTRVDESRDDHELYSEAITTLRELDPHRPCLGVRDFKESECLEDIYAYNDFSCWNLEHGLDDPKTVKGANGKPLLISEHNGHIHPTKSFDRTDRRLQQALRHLRVMDDAYANDRYAGAIGWCAYDYNTHPDFGSGDHICYHGVFDIFRNPKPAAFAYRSQRSDKIVMEPADLPIPGDENAAHLHPIWLLTNVDCVKFYRNGKFVKDFYPDKEDFPHIPHPPIKINDYVGELWDEPDIKESARKKIVPFINRVGEVGTAGITLKQKMRMLPLLLSKKTNIKRITSLYWKYISGWGGIANRFEIEGYKDGKCVIKRSINPAESFRFAIRLSQETLKNEDTYDVTRVSVTLEDQDGNICPYANQVISLETEGPIEVIGPKHVALIGGALSFYVRSKAVAHPETANLSIKTHLGIYDYELSVL